MESYGIIVLLITHYYNLIDSNHFILFIFNHLHCYDPYSLFNLNCFLIIYHWYLKQILNFISKWILISDAMWYFSVRWRSCHPSLCSSAVLTLTPWVSRSPKLDHRGCHFSLGLNKLAICHQRFTLNDSLDDAHTRTSVNWVTKFSMHRTSISLSVAELGFHLNLIDFASWEASVIKKDNFEDSIQFC